jgi:hypothetical protein
MGRQHRPFQISLCIRTNNLWTDTKRKAKVSHECDGHPQKQTNREARIGGG